MCSIAVSLRTSKGGLIALNEVIYFERSISQKLNEQFLKIKIVDTDGNIVYLAKVNPDIGLKLRCSCDNGFPQPSFQWSKPLQNLTAKVMSDYSVSRDFCLEFDKNHVINI